MPLHQGKAVQFEGWTIYDHPKDHPEHYVVRRWVIYRGDKHSTPCLEAVLCKTLHAARRCVPGGLHKMPRQQEDDPVIVETWI